MSALKGTHAQPTHELYELARKSRECSYSPYSGFKVGAAVRLSDGRAFGGCNVENSSYGGAVCAERTAILKAVSESTGQITISEVVVVTDAHPPWPPCGFCRQVIAEFGTPSTRILSTNLQGETLSNSFGELFPHAFTPANLKK